MCGIAGIIDFKGRFTMDTSLLESMAYPLRFRGPDQQGQLIERSDRMQVGLTHRRLSIIDLSEEGRQPMTTADGRCTIVFNGEIYNYRELRAVMPIGTEFRSESDTEVILHVYRAWGIEKCLDLLEGMFAFAILDRDREELILARDRFGEKPLYYFQADGALAFSSDIRSFNALPIAKTIDPYAAGYFFSELSTPSEHSIWKEVGKLPASHYLRFGGDGPGVHRYWDLDYRHKVNHTLEDSIDHVGSLLDDAVKSRMVADVPVGCFLSGGLDSSLVALHAAKHCSGRLKTFSVGFEHEAFNELPYARQVAEHIGSDHHEIVLSAKDLNVVNQLLMEYGEPFADSSQIPSYHVARFAARHVKAVLGGDGGDEVFAGYGTHIQAYRMQLWYEKRALKPVLQLIAPLKGNGKANYLQGVMGRDVATLASALDRGMGFNPLQLSRLLSDSVSRSAASAEGQRIMADALKAADGVFDPLLYACMRTRLVNDYFVKTDRATMFNSLELRTPMVHRGLVEYVSSLPYTHLRKDGNSKHILKALLARHFPPEFVNRKKMGFGIPIGQWIRTGWRGQFEEVIRQRQQLIAIDYSFVDRLMADHMDGKADHTHRLWAVYVFHRWAEQQKP